MKERPVLVRISQLNTQTATLHLQFILPCKLSQNPRNVTMREHHVPNHGTEEISEQLGTMSFFRASPAAGILSTQSSHRHLNLPPTPSDPSRGPI